MIDEPGLTELGRRYKAACAHRVFVYLLAQELAEKPLAVTQFGQAQVDELTRVSDLEVGVMLAADWGADVPTDLLLKVGAVMPILGPRVLN